MLLEGHLLVPPLHCTKNNCPPGVPDTLSPPLLLGHTHGKQDFGIPYLHGLLLLLCGHLLGVCPPKVSQGRG